VRSRQDEWPGGAIAREMTNLSHTCAVHAPDRRRILAAMAGLTISIAAAPARLAAAAPASVDDERFMRMAIDEARQADYPFGAVIVRDGEVIARGANLGRRLDDPTAHGEMQAIRHGLAQHCGGPRSIPPASRVPCAWGRSSGAISAAWSTRRPWISWRPRSTSP
jgi:hypothetical protein